MGFLTRRKFLAGVGVGTAGGAALISGKGGATTRATARGHRQNGQMAGTVGRVDHARNGFNPTELLTDFDPGTTSRDASGRVVREYEFTAINKEIEVAPGVFFPAWTYNGRVPGPTIRATEGDRVRVNLINASSHRHTVHFHGIHPSGMDGVPGAGEIEPGEEFVYDFIAAPFGTHLYHCHSFPLTQHIHRGLYGAFIVDPKEGRPEANEMVMVMNGFDTNFDGENEVYAINTVAFHYVNEPIQLSAKQLQRAHVINVTEFDPLNSIHLHANFFHLFRTGTSLEPDDFTDTISMGQAERHMIEFSYDEPGEFMFHAHQTEFVELGWMSFFRVT
jgi:FtsP/CotA-like multicopper oxidase with cupredoxin domain